LAAVAAKKAEFDELGVAVLAISTNSQFVHKIWQETELSKLIDGGFPWPMLADMNGQIGRMYGVYEEDAGVNIRGRFIIDPDGTIQAMEVLTPSVGRNVSETLRQIRAFQHVRATGEATPSGWQPGKATLKPGPDLVGKVWEVWSVDQAF
jgi:alkyl hydroperoxide reductase subunit AhpC